MLKMEDGPSPPRGISLSVVKMMERVITGNNYEPEISMETEVASSAEEGLIL